MIFYAVTAQSVSDSTAIMVSFVTVLIGILTVASGAMKRMVDSHFEYLEELKGRVDDLEKREKALVAEIRALRIKLESAENLSEEQKREYEGAIQQVEEKYKTTLAQKDNEIEKLQKQIDGLQAQISELRNKLNEMAAQYETSILERDRLRTETDTLRAQDQKLRLELEQAIQEKTFNYEVRLALEKRLHEAGTDTQELRAIREAIQSQTKADT